MGCALSGYLVVSRSRRDWTHTVQLRLRGPASRLDHLRSSVVKFKCQAKRHKNTGWTQQGKHRHQIRWPAVEEDGHVIRLGKGPDQRRQKQTKRCSAHDKPACESAHDYNPADRTSRSVVMFKMNGKLPRSSSALSFTIPAPSNPLAPTIPQPSLNSLSLIHLFSTTMPPPAEKNHTNQNNDTQAAIKAGERASLSASQRRNAALAEVNEAKFSRFHVKTCIVAGALFLNPS